MEAAMGIRLIAASIAIVAIGSGAVSAKSHGHYRHATAPRHVAAQRQQIACTVLGCQPIPAACIPKEEHTSSGIPTGYDTIVCPPGIWPF